MANFDIAFKRTAQFEGGYVYDPDDNGGETYAGISRKANPKWAGWKTIDAAKKKSNFPKSLKNDIILQTQVKTLYRTNYWNTIWGDKITNQDVANDLYDTGVNMGVAMSIKLAQRQFRMTQTGKMSDGLLKKLNSVTSIKK